MLANRDHLRIMMENESFYRPLNESDEKLIQELNEGLVVFKMSTRLEKYAKRIEKQMTTVRFNEKLRDEQKQQIQTLYEDLKKVAQDLRAVENSFKNKQVSRSEANMKMKIIRQKHQYVFNKLRSVDTIKTLKTLGISAGIIAGIISIVFGAVSLATGVPFLNVARAAFNLVKGAVSQSAFGAFLQKLSTGKIAGAVENAGTAIANTQLGRAVTGAATTSAMSGSAAMQMFTQ
jgi:hypothetical protein